MILIQRIVSPTQWAASLVRIFNQRLTNLYQSLRDNLINTFDDSLIPYLIKVFTQSPISYIIKYIQYHI